jgi:hypothetical protein
LDRAGEGRWNKHLARTSDDAASGVAADEEIVIKAQCSSCQRPVIAVYVVVHDGKEWGVGACCWGSAQAQAGQPEAAPDVARKATKR